VYVVCVPVLLCLSMCLCLRSHIRHCTADDDIYTTLSKRKEKADIRYCSFTSSLLSRFIFTITTTLRTHTHTTQLLLTDLHTVQKTSKQTSKQVKQASKAVYTHSTRLIRHLLFKVCIFLKKIEILNDQNN